MILLPFATGLLIARAFCQEATGPSERCDDLDRVLYSPPRPERLKKVVVTREVPQQQELSKLEAAPSPQGTARLFISRPDYMKAGPWTTRAYVVGNTARPLALEIRFDDHASYGVVAKWINEKLIHFHVSWGRIVGTDMILNVETAVFLYAEEANYSITVLPCEEKRRAVPK